MGRFFTLICLYTHNTNYQHNKFYLYNLNVLYIFPWLMFSLLYLHNSRKKTRNKSQTTQHCFKQGKKVNCNKK